MQIFLRLQMSPRRHGPWIALPISYRAISPTVAAFDATWVILVGIGSGLAYDAIGPTNSNLIPPPYLRESAGGVLRPGREM
jgi:hypothetical protein